MNDRDRNKDGRAAGQEGAGRTSPGHGAPDPGADLDGLARDWITLWQSEIAALAHDREAAETVARVCAIWSGLAAFWLRAVPPAQPPPAAHEPPAAATLAAARPAAAAAAPDAGLASLHHLLGELGERLGGIERRLANLEGGGIEGRGIEGRGLEGGSSGGTGDHRRAGGAGARKRRGGSKAG